MGLKIFSKAVILVMAMLALATIGHAFSFGFKPQDKGIATGLTKQGYDNDDAFLNTKYTLQESLQTVVNIVNDANSKPSCQKAATAALMHSCSSLERSTRQDAGVDVLTSEANKAYAARLAVCQIKEAKDAAVPAACQVFVPTERTTKKRAMAGHVTSHGFGQPTMLYLDYDDATKENLDDCVAALWQTQQSWTSYSNSKQDSYHICNALQAVLRHEDSVETYQRLFEAALGLGEYLENIPKEAQALFQQVKENVLQFWVSLYEDDHERRQEVAQLWKDQVADFRREMLHLQQEGFAASRENIKHVQHATNELARFHSQFVANQQQQEVAYTQAIDSYIARLQDGFAQALGKTSQELQSQYQQAIQTGLAFASFIEQINNGQIQLMNGYTDLDMKVQGVIVDVTFMQAMLNDTVITAHNISMSVEKFSGVVDSVSTLLNHGVHGLTAALGVFAIFAGCVFLYTALIYEFLGRRFSLWALTFSLTFGTVLAFITALYTGPLVYDVLTQSSSHFPSDSS